MRLSYKSSSTLAVAIQKPGLLGAVFILQIEGLIHHAQRQIDHIVQGIKIPHAEKVFSLYQPHTEWISKGKAGVPVEPGFRSAYCKTVRDTSSCTIG